MSKSSMSTSASPSSIDAVVRSPVERANDAYHFRVLRKILTTASHRGATTISLSYNLSSGETGVWYQSDRFGREHMYNREGKCVFSSQGMEELIRTLNEYAQPSGGSFSITLKPQNVVTFQLTVQESPSGKTAELKATYGPRPYH